MPKLIPEFYLSFTDPAKPFKLINVMQTDDYLFDFHRHDFYHVNHITDGVLTVTIGTSEYEVRAGQTMILPPGIAHRLRSQGYKQIGMDIAICEDDRLLSQSLCELAGGKFHLLTPSRHEDFTAMKRLLTSPSVANRQSALNFAERILLDAFAELRPKSDRDFALEFTAKCPEPWRMTLAEMGRALGLSRSNLERRAKTSFGCGASEYAARLRLAEVSRMLKSTDLPLAEIASRLGFSSPGHMSVFCRERTGVSPSKLRRDRM